MAKKLLLLVELTTSEVKDAISLIIERLYIDRIIGKGVIEVG